MSTVFTSESVTSGHPDKLCDHIADSILDAILKQDPQAHVACEVTATTDKLHIMGEITTEAHVDYEQIARKVIAQTGYTQKGTGFDAETCQVQVDIHEQSPDIAMGVNRSVPLDAGAGDQGMMFGFACNETQHYMPFAIEYANALTRQLETLRKNKTLPWLKPDGKSQLSVEYNQEGAPARIAAVVLSAQHDEKIPLEDLRQALHNKVISHVLPPWLMDEDTGIFINPTGRFVIGGPAGDSGLTGRKIIADTYGGYARHGGGSFSGKDASKVDRTAAYMARYLAKNVVHAGLADRCEVQLGYAIGLAEPVSVYITDFGTGKVPNGKILDYLIKHVDLRPMAITRRFGLDKPFYAKLSCYGHFGENAANMPWEQCDLSEELRAKLLPERTRAHAT